MFLKISVAFFSFARGQSNSSKRIGKYDLSDDDFDFSRNENDYANGTTK